MGDWFLLGSELMASSGKTLNEAYSTLSARRRYEVWFLRCGLRDGSGAWWFRYLLLNPGRSQCGANSLARPAQVWATFFQPDQPPQTFIQGFSLEHFQFSRKGQSPFRFAVDGNAIDDGSCHGQLSADGHEISWDLRYSSTFRNTLSNKGWIGFSRTPHSDAQFFGRITLDGRTVQGQPLGFGIQGHNCGYRHRGFWVWTHAYFIRPNAMPTTLEVLLYDMPFGLLFRKAVLWHEGREYPFRNVVEEARNSERLKWNFSCGSREAHLDVEVDGGGTSLHRLPYMKTDYSGNFLVANNSLAKATVRIQRPGELVEILETQDGAVLEMGGERAGISIET